MLDLLAIGGGNVALTAALMAREAGASVLMLEASPRERRGGNSQYMRNLHCMHAAPQDVLSGRSVDASMPAVDPEPSVVLSKADVRDVAVRRVPGAAGPS